MSTSGTLKNFLAEKGFGFVAPDDGGKDVFVHVKANPNLLSCEGGERVTFKRVMDRQKNRHAGVELAVTGASDREGWKPPGTEQLRRVEAVSLDPLLPFINSGEFAQTVLRQLESDGYIILPGMFSQEEVDHEYARMWRWVEAIAPSIRRERPETWMRHSAQRDPWPCAQRDMMQLHQAGWVFSELREKMASRVFEPLYGTHELHSSKDGFTLQRPTQGELGRTPNDHFDQGITMHGLNCIQGSVALTDQEESDGCFMCWPGSHRHHREILEGRGYKRGRANFVILNDAEKELLRSHGIESRRVPVKRGDVILWRSDVAHCGAPPLGARETFRGVVYICMLPAALTPEEVYPKKLQAYERLETGSHWPNDEEWFEPNRRNTFVPAQFFREPPQLTLRQRQLYGLEHYPKTGEAAAAQATACSYPKAAGEAAATEVTPGAKKNRWNRGSH